MGEEPQVNTGNHRLCKKNPANDPEILKSIKEIWPYANLSSHDNFVPSDSGADEFIKKRLPTNMSLISIFNNDRTSTSGFIVKCNDESHNCILVSFRGSKEDLDWVRNFLLVKLKKWYPNNDSKHWFKRFITSVYNYFRNIGIKEEVHSGFLGNYNSVRAEITNKLQTISDINSKIYITGHSLGGSVGLYVR